MEVHFAKNSPDSAHPLNPKPRINAASRTKTSVSRAALQGDSMQPRTGAQAVGQHGRDDYV